jgi:hypothetical protein
MPSMSELALTDGRAEPRLALEASGSTVGPAATRTVTIEDRRVRPTAGRFRLRPAPSREPPFDDEPDARLLSAACSGEQQLPFAGPPQAPFRLRLPSVGSADQEAHDDLPEPSGFARRFAIAVIEAATGRRTASQLSSHTSPGVQAGLARDAGRIGRLGTASRPARLHSMHLAEPSDGVIEAAAVVRVGARYRAIAFRLEGLHGRWRCVRLQIG